MKVCVGRNRGRKFIASGSDFRSTFRRFGCGLESSYSESEPGDAMDTPRRYMRERECPKTRGRRADGYCDVTSRDSIIKWRRPVSTKFPPREATKTFLLVSGEMVRKTFCRNQRKTIGLMKLKMTFIFIIPLLYFFYLLFVRNSIAFTAYGTPRLGDG